MIEKMSRIEEEYKSTSEYMSQLKTELNKVEVRLIQLSSQYELLQELTIDDRSS